MTSYYDTGILLKLYTEEAGSEAIRAFVVGRKQHLFLNSLHQSECTSALRLKVFRKECESYQASRALAHMEEDFRSGILKVLPTGWEETWTRCRSLSDTYAATTGCRTLDAIHVACAILSPANEFISSDRRQMALAKEAGLLVINPLES